MLNAAKLAQRWRELCAAQVARETSPFEFPCAPIAQQLLAPELPASLFDRFETYGRRVLEANARLNLVSRRDPESQIADNILESLPFLSIWPAILTPLLPDVPVSRETQPIQFLLDAGSGSGIPGVPLRLGLEALAHTPLPSLLLAESRNKKAYFLLQLLEELGLADSEALPFRLESPELAEHLASRELSRGVLSTRGLAEIDRTFQWAQAVKERFVAAHLIKGGPKLRQEFSRDAKKWRRRGWTLARHEGFHIEDRFSEHLTFFLTR